MDQIHLMGVFIAVGEAESFAKAARRLDVSPSAVTRAISSIEELLGVKLLLRTTRNVRLTEAGRRYLDDCKNILAVLAEANEAVKGLKSGPSGHLSVTASVLFGKLYVMPCILRFMQECREVEVSAYFLDRVVDMADESVDVAVRIGHLPVSNLKALKVGQVRRVLCASPKYLARNGVPRYPVDLTRHMIVAASHTLSNVEWKFGSKHDQTSVLLKPRLTVTSNDAAIDAVKDGLGICRLLNHQIAGELTEGHLKIVLEEFEESPWPVHVLHRECKYRSSKVNRFIDMLVELLRAQEHLNCGLHLA